MNPLPLRFLFFFLVLAGTLCASPVKPALDGDADIINVKLTVRELAVSSQPDTFENLPESSSERQNQAVPFQPKEQTANENVKKEAERFFAEYQILTKSKSATLEERGARLDAALALAPGNPHYRFAEIELAAERIKEMRKEDRIREWPRQWERCRRFRDEFPTFQRDVSHAYRVLPGLNRRDGGEAEIAEPILAQMRPYAEREARLWYPCPPEERIGTLTELLNYGMVSLICHNSNDYISFRKCLFDQLQSEHAFFRAAEALAGKHPEQLTKISQKVDRLGYIGATNLTKFEVDFPEKNKLAVINGYLNSDELNEFIRMGEASSFETFQGQAMLLRYMRKLCAANGDKAVIAKILAEYFADLEQRFPGSMNLPDKPENWESGENAALLFHMDNFVRLLTEAHRFFRDEKRKYGEQNHKYSAWARFEDAAKRNDLEQILQRDVPVMRSNNYDRLCKNRTGNLYGNVAYAMFDREENFSSRAAEELFKVANADFTIQTHTYEEQCSGFPPSDHIDVLMGAARHETETALLFRLKNDPFLHLAFLRDDGTVSSQTKTPVQAESFAGRNDLAARRPAPVAFDGNSVAIADKSGTIHLFNRARQRWERFEDVAPTTVVSVAMDRDRIWFLCGGNLFKADFCTLISLSPEDGMRKIYFSTARSDKQNELDSLAIQELNSLTRLNGKLYFTVTTRSNTMVYELDPQSGAFTQIVKFPLTGSGIDQLWRQEDQLYCFTMGPGERIYRIHPDSRRAEWLFNQSGSRYQFDSPDAKPVTMRGGCQMNAPWRFQGDLLYSSHCTPGVIRLKDPEKSPLLLLPGCAYLFNLGDRMLFLGRRRFFIVKMKEEAK